jgi:sugar phosphate isomerase/epimerase
MGFAKFTKWLAENGFGAVDVSGMDQETRDAVKAAGLEVGTCDVMQHVAKTLSPDEKERAEGVNLLKKQITELAGLGAKRLFCVLMPKDGARGRKANFEIWKETWPEIVAHAEANNVCFAIEWWPGGAPYYSSLGCTPEMWRKMLAVCPSKALGFCYDPSHLARLQIDWMRALHEVGDRIVHVHAKDTEILPERLYEQGTLGASFGVDMGFSEGYWRYCIPGDGVVDWRKVQARLEHVGFNGVFSVELEDYRYWKDGEAQKQGLLAAKKHLQQFVR